MLNSRDIWLQLQAFRLQLVMALVSGVLFAVPHQTREIYRALAQMLASVKPMQQSLLQVITFEISLAVAGVVAVCVTLWFTARRSASFHQSRGAASAADAALPDFAHRPWLLTWMPRALAALPLVFAAGGVYLASVGAGVVDRLRIELEPVFTRTYLRITGDEAISTAIAKGNITELMRFNGYLETFALTLLAIAAVVVVFVSLIDRPALAAWLFRLRSRPVLITPMVTCVALFAMVAAVLIWPVTVPRYMGAIFIMSVFLVMLQLILMQLQIWRQHNGVPITLILILGAILFSLQDWNDNHAIRSLADTPSTAPRDLGFKQAFKRWIGSRKDLKRYEGSNYPIYIAAAQGGGIYAAKHAASFLAELQDLCPGFGHHLFAISGVSGGSVGASVFAGLSQQYDWPALNDDLKYGCVADLKAQRAEHFSFATTEMFRQDLWSPLAASLLFPDFMQRFLPVPLPSWDRGRALEFTLEDSYDRAVRVTSFPVSDAAMRPLARSFMAHWDPENHPFTPALLLNTTEVGTGRRRVAAPFSFGPAGLKFIPVFATVQPAGDDADQSGSDRIVPPEINPPLSAAAGLSARFPWVTPSAHFYERVRSEDGSASNKKVSVVDGGYFENSGVVTALDLIKQMVEVVRDGALDQKVEINLLVFTSANFDTGETSGLGEAVDPMRAIFNARTARGGIAIEEAISTLTLMSSTNGPVRAEVVKLELNGYGYPLPLGWRLSPITRHLISLHNGAAADCDDGAVRPDGKGEIVTASCVKQRVFERLR